VPVSLLDLTPTLVELAGGGDDTDYADGRSLVGALRGSPLPAADVVLEYPAEGVRGRRRWSSFGAALS
jgi:arylsulfatase A-like enzyme